jgi:hypothetical protein
VTVRHHALTDAAFTALAAGRPSMETIDELRRAQSSKHALLLRAIVQAVHPTTLPGYADLAAADPTVVRGLIADPLFGVWAAGCLGALTRGASPADAGVHYVADLAALLEAPNAAGRSSRRLRAAHSGLVIDVRLEDVDPLRSRLGLTPTGRLSAAEFEHWQDCLTGAWRLLVDRHRPAAEVLAAVLSVIVPVEPDRAARGISATSADAFGAVAMSAPADAVELAVGLLHEIQHSVLNAVYYLFDLHGDPATLGYSPWRDDPRPASGILHGAYAYLAVTRFWRTEAALPKAGHPETSRSETSRSESFGGEIGRAVAAFEFARWRAAVTATADELLGGGGLTAAGTRFMTALRNEVSNWLDEPVPPEVARLAAGANIDHRTRWRLRNLRFDPSDAETLANTWQRGLPAPAELAPSRLIPAPRRALEDNDRLALTHQLLRTHPHPDLEELWSTTNQDPPRSRVGGEAGDGGDAIQPREGLGGEVLGALQPGGAATAGDAAYLRGDYRTAADAYLKRLEDDTSWAGLAMVSPHQCLQDRPEVVAAIYRAIAGEKPDPRTLANWISG